MDIAKLIADFEAIAADVKAMVPELEAAGIDVQKFFADAATGTVSLKHACMAAAPDVTASKINWANLLKIAETYGPVVYAMLAAMLGWPPLPVIPPVVVPTPPA